MDAELNMGTLGDTSRMGCQCKFKAMQGMKSIFPCPRCCIRSSDLYHTGTHSVATTLLLSPLLISSTAAANVRSFSLLMLFAENLFHSVFIGYGRIHLISYILLDYSNIVMLNMLRLGMACRKPIKN